MPPKPSLFELLDHCCSVCGGRLLRADTERGILLRCAECGARAELPPGSRAPYEALCFCGVKLAGGKNAGLRCRRAATPSPERPQEVVVLHVPQEPKANPQPGASRPVRVPGQDS